MNIKLKTLAGEQFEVECPEDENIETLKAIVMTSKPHLVDPKIIYKGKIMKDDSSLEACGITPAVLESGGFLVVHAKKSDSGAASAATPVPAPAPVPAAAPVAPVAPQPTTAPSADNDAQNAAQAAQTQARAAQEAVLEQGLQQLIGMGFAREQALMALQAAFGNVDRAVQYLFDPASIPTPEQQRQAAQAATTASAARAPQESVAPPTKLDVSGGWSRHLGPQLLVNPMSIRQNTDEYLSNKDLVILYLSAHWCPPCKKFTPHLTMAYGAAGDSKMAIIFLSVDRDEQSFFSYFQSMPWAAVPFSQDGATQSIYTNISGLLGLRGIPSLVVCRANGDIVSLSGVKEVMEQRCDLVACARTWRGATSSATSAAASIQPAVPQTTQPSNAKSASSATSAKWHPKVVPADKDKINAALQRVATDTWDVQEKFYSTMLKVLSNILASPSEQKFRSIKRTVKIFDMGENAAIDCLSSVGFTVAPDNLLFEGQSLGELHWLHAETQNLANQSYERKQRLDRDERIKEENERDRQRQPRYYGTEEENGRTKYGTDRRRGGGGGGG